MSRLIDALNCRNEGRPPIWLMRQAGRYLPEYRSLKKGRALFEMFHDTETIVEVTLLPIDILGVDGAILFSDILTVLDGLNISYDFKEGIGPVVAETSDDQICRVNPNEAYSHIIESIKLLKKELKVPLLGFAGAPFTIASYILEGKTSRDLRKTKELLYRDPIRFHELLDKITDATIDYLNCQIDAGVEAVQIFDSWANALPLEEFREFSLKYMGKIVAALKRKKVPVILFCRGSCFFAEELASLSPAAISLDWSGDLAQGRKLIHPSIAVQGNLDPMALYASPEEIGRRVDLLLNKMSGEPGYIFNLGHGLLPDIPVDHVKFLVDHVRGSPAFAQAQ